MKEDTLQATTKKTSTYEYIAHTKKEKENVTTNPNESTWAQWRQNYSKMSTVTKPTSHYTVYIQYTRNETEKMCSIAVEPNIIEKPLGNHKHTYQTRTIATILR